jgi:hypothetical protein
MTTLLSNDLRGRGETGESSDVTNAYAVAIFSA